MPFLLIKINLTESITKEKFLPLVFQHCPRCEASKSMQADLGQDNFEEEFV